jgi:hypothetical protein
VFWGGFVGLLSTNKAVLIGVYQAASTSYGWEQHGVTLKMFGLSVPSFLPLSIKARDGEDSYQIWMSHETAVRQKLINHFWGKNIFQVFKHGFQLVFREWFPAGAASNRQMPEAAEALRGQNLVGSQGRKKVDLLTLSGTSSAENSIVYSYLVGGFKHFLFSIIYGMSSFPLTNSYFSRWLKPPTSHYL